MLLSLKADCKLSGIDYIVTTEECEKLHQIAHDYELYNSSRPLWDGLRGFTITTFDPARLRRLKKAKMEIEHLLNCEIVK